MTAYELLEELERLFIITRIGDEYFISQDVIKSRKTDSVVEKPIPDKIPKSEYSEILDKPDDVSKWPYEIVHSRGRKRADAFMVYGKVPNVSSTGNYRLRGLNIQAIQAIEILVDKNPNLRADILFEEIAYYYKHTEYPKGFKNLVLEGDMLDLYNEALDRIKNKVFRINPDDANSNTTWG